MTRPVVWPLALTAALCAPASALTLYAPALGSLPDSQGWVPAGAGAQVIGDGLLVQDTTGAGVLSFVNGRAAPRWPRLVRSS